jgi:hypothetical protein
MTVRDRDPAVPVPDGGPAAAAAPGQPVCGPTRRASGAGPGPVTPGAGAPGRALAIS